MSWIKSDNKIEQKHFDFLEGLRESGVTNMFGASPFLKEAFPKDFRTRQHAAEVLGRWMSAHDDPTLLYVEPAKRKKAHKIKKEQAV